VCPFKGLIGCLKEVVDGACGVAVGCGKLGAPARGWLRHGGDDVTMIGCDTSSEQWELRCQGNAWMTHSGDTAASINCTQGAYILL